MGQSLPLRTACADLVPLVPDHEQDEPTPTQGASSPQLRPKTPFLQCRSARPQAPRRFALVLIMQFPPSNPVRALPANAAAWSRVAAATRDGYYAAWGADSRERPLLQARRGGPALGLHHARRAAVSTAQRHRILPRPAARLGRGPQPRDRPRVRPVAGHARVVRSVGRGRRPAGLVADQRDGLPEACAHVGCRACDGRAARAAQDHRGLVRAFRGPQRFRGRSGLDRLVAVAYDSRFAHTA